MSEHAKQIQDSPKKNPKRSPPKKKGEIPKHAQHSKIEHKMPKRSKQIQDIPKTMKKKTRQNIPNKAKKINWDGLFWNVLEFSLMVGYNITTQNSLYE